MTAEVKTNRFVLSLRSLISTTSASSIQQMECVTNPLRTLNSSRLVRFICTTAARLYEIYKYPSLAILACFYCSTLFYIFSYLYIQLYHCVTINCFRLIFSRSFVIARHDNQINTHKSNYKKNYHLTAAASLKKHCDNNNKR